SSAAATSTSLVRTLMRLFLSSPLFLSLPLAAQFTSPPGAPLGVNAGNQSVLATQPFGAAAAGRRMQYIVGDITAGPQTITALKFQSDNSATSARTINLLVQMGHATRGTACSPSTTFASNYAGAPVIMLDDGAGNPTSVNLPATTSYSPIPIPFNSGANFNYDGTSELIVDIIADSASPSGNYSLDTHSGACSPTAGSSTYLGLTGCVVPPNTSQFDIFKSGPSSASGTTSCRQYALRGPANSIGILSIGVTDPNSTFGGLLCAPLRAMPDVYAGLFVPTDASGGVASSGNPVDLQFPDTLAPFTFYTQFV